MASQVPDPSRAIFNLHCPPFKSGLDEAPAIDADLKLLHGGRALRPVGSTAVREAIERHQPLLSLHGHIHESKGAIKIGKTLDRKSTRLNSSQPSKSYAVFCLKKKTVCAAPLSGAADLILPKERAPSEAQS